MLFPSISFGYVSFNEIEEAKAAVEALNGSDIDGRNIRLDFAQERSNDGGSFGGGRGGRGGAGRGGRGGRGGNRGGRGGSSSRGKPAQPQFAGKKTTFDD